jgi:ribosomal protein L22
MSIHPFFIAGYEVAKKEAEAIVQAARSEPTALRTIAHRIRTMKIPDSAPADTEIAK